MRHAFIITTTTAMAAALLSACASPPPPKVAQNKTVDVAGQKFDLGGVYDAGNRRLSLSVNGDPVMAGSFPPYTPTMHLKAPYKGVNFAATCYFGSVLSGHGMVGIVAGAVQGAKGKSGDKCDMLVGDKVLETLYF